MWLRLHNCSAVFLHPQEAESGFVPSVQDFDKKLAEADAYLQILIDQLKVGVSVEALNSPYHFIHNNSQLHYVDGWMDGWMDGWIDRKCTISTTQFEVFG